MVNVGFGMYLNQVSKVAHISRYISVRVLSCKQQNLTLADLAENEFIKRLVNSFKGKLLITPNTTLPN